MVLLELLGLANSKEESTRSLARSNASCSLLFWKTRKRPERSKVGWNTELLVAIGRLVFKVQKNGRVCGA